jgi:O-antigen ligase
MRYVLALLFILLIAGDVFGWNQSLAPGLSVKNAMIYIAGLMLAARLVLSRTTSLEFPRILIWMGVLVGYAMFTWLAVGFVIHYKSYKIISAGIDLKAMLIDYFVVFALCLYGIQTLADVKFVIKALLIGLTCANAIAIGDIVGLFQIGVTMVGTEGVEAGRAFGAFGHANETAALVICLLPAYVAVAVTSRGVMRLFWAGAGLVSATMMLMTGSRGAFVGLTVGGVIGWYTCRRLISFARTVPLLIGLAVLAVPVLLLVNMKFGSVLTDRVIEMLQDPMTRSGDRTSIWLQGISRMMDHPLTLLTGFGWDSYSVMGFFFATHNYYLLLWFELGVIGVLSYLAIIRGAVLTARSAAELAPADLRGYLVAFIFGICFVSVAIFFSLLFKPWLYIWAYIGVTMRLAAIVTANAKQAARTTPTRAAASAAATGRRLQRPKRSLQLRGGR